MDSKVKESEAFCFYVSGFVDGEGCFSISFRKLNRNALGFETRASFSLGQKQTPTNYKLLERLRLLFEGGGIRKDQDGCYKYETRALSHLITKIIPFFKKFPLYSSKSEDFDKFCKICSLMAAKQHLNRKGLLQIIDITTDMNPSGIRRLKLLDIRAQLEKNSIT